jgi:hypothetical protein
MNLRNDATLSFDAGKRWRGAGAQKHTFATRASQQEESAAMLPRSNANL